MARRDVDLLARVPIFSGLSKRHLRSVSALATQRRFDEDAQVAEEGKPGDDFFVILTGEARVVRGGRTVAKLIPGDFFGEIALLDGGPRTAAIVADTPLQVMVLSRKPFQEMLEREPTIVLKMLEELAGRLRNVERSLTG